MAGPKTTDTNTTTTERTETALVEVAPVVTGKIERPSGRPLENPAVKYLGTLADSSRKSMTAILDRIAGMCGRTPAGKPLTHLQFDWRRLRYTHFADIMSRLRKERHWRTQDPLAPATLNLFRAAIRGVMRQAFRMGMIDAEAYTRLREVDAVRGSRKLAGRAVVRRERAALRKICDPRTPLGARDLAMIALLYNCGLRCGADAAPLDVSAWNPIDGSLRIIGKGNKERTAYLTGTGRRALEAWLAHRGDLKGPLFLTIAPKGNIARSARRLSVQAMRARIKGLAKAAGVPRFTPHDLRRSVIGDMLDKKVDLVTVSEFAGHSKTDTTKRYDRRGERSLRKAAALIDE